MTAPEPKTPILSAVWGLPPSLVFTKKVPNIETKIPDAAKNNGKNTRLFSPAVAAKTIAPIIEPTYDSKRSAPIPATSPTLSPTLSAIVAGFLGSSSGISASTFPTKSAPTSAALV